MTAIPPMTSLLAFTGGLLVIGSGFVLKVRYGRDKKFAAYVFGGMGGVMVGILDSGLLTGRASLIIGLGVFVGWMLSGLWLCIWLRKKIEEKRNVIGE
jgi:hypothetical protein